MTELETHIAIALSSFRTFNSLDRDGYIFDALFAEMVQAIRALQGYNINYDEFWTAAHTRAEASEPPA